jgi:hypothetical protein
MTSRAVSSIWLDGSRGPAGLLSPLCLLLYVAKAWLVIGEGKPVRMAEPSFDDAFGIVLGSCQYKLEPFWLGVIPGPVGNKDLT